MSDVRDDLEATLYAGESIRETVDAGPHRLAVTTHRLLAATPAAEGANFHEIALPNVEDVRAVSGGQARHLRRAIGPLLLGAALLVGGGLLEPEGLVDSTLGSGTTGAGTGVLTVLQGFVGLLALLDDALRIGGAVCLLVAAGFGGLYLRSRESALVVAVAGSDDLRIPVAGAENDAQRLRAALNAADRSDDADGDHGERPTASGDATQ